MNLVLRCSECGNDNPTEAHFCANCGTSLGSAAQLWRCPGCGTSNPQLALFCGNCGASPTEALTPTVGNEYLTTTAPTASPPGEWDLIDLERSADRLAHALDQVEEDVATRDTAEPPRSADAVEERMERLQQSAARITDSLERLQADATSDHGGPASASGRPIRCPRCDAENPPTAAFCGHCGASLASEPGTTTSPAPTSSRHEEVDA